MSQRIIGRVVRLAACACAASLLLAAPAFAGTIRFDVVENPAFTIQDNGNGIVKLTYNGCVTAGVRQTIAFRTTISVSADGNATYNILREEGEAPAAAFNPPSVALAKGSEQSFDTTLSFTLSDQNNGITTFRIKLDPDSGEGLGEGAGIMVSIPCVLAAPPASGAAAPAAPAAGYLPAVASGRARGSARCVSTPRGIRLRAHRTTLLRVTVSTNGQRISRALVRVTGPGFVRRRHTGSGGTALFTLRPSRAGRVLVQSDVCFGADRLTVLDAVPVVPHFTG